MHVPEIPQDIINNIIGELTGDSDSDTLKCCATVSRSFLHPSRRSLFAAISVHTQRQTERLHDLLTSVPEISLYIHELRFSICKRCSRHPKAWLKEDKTLASVLRMLPSLQVLSWGKKNANELQWDVDFSNELRSALLDFFRSPSLATVTFTNHRSLPLSVFSAFTHVKKLCLLDLQLQGTSALPPFQLTQLEALTISVQIDEEDAEFFTPTSSSFPNLSFLSITSSSDGNSLFNQRIIQSSTRSIKRLSWTVYWQTPNVDLGIIENLQVVTFISHFGGTPGFCELLEYLKNPSVTESLKELTLGIIIDGVDPITLPSFEGWKDLDSILFSRPNLQKVLTVLACASLEDLEDPSTSQLPSVIQGQLPLLECRGILSVVTSTIPDLGGF